MASKTTHAGCEHPKTWPARKACNKGADALAYFMSRMDADEQKAIYERRREYNAKPERRERQQERAKLPANRERHRERHARPEYLKYRRERATLPKERAMALAKNIRRRRLKADTAVEPIINDDIFERDNWTCHLCGNPVDPFTFYPHPESPSLDHIKPLSEGGTHTEDNVACAHLRCNLSKGNRYEVAL